MIIWLNTLNRKAAQSLLLLRFVLMPVAAHGHAYPDHADPKVSATITTSLTIIRIWFARKL